MFYYCCLLFLLFSQTTALLSPSNGQLTEIKCLDNSSPFYKDEDICGDFDLSNNILYIRSCLNGVFCPIRIEHGQFRCSEEIKLQKEGEICSVNTDCKTNVCRDNICSTLSEGEKCSTNNECEHSCYCSSETNTCTKVTLMGGKCKTTNECTYGALCIPKEEGGETFCLAEYSFKEGEWAPDIKACEGLHYNSTTKKCVRVEYDLPDNQPILCQSNLDCPVKEFVGDEVYDSYTLCQSNFINHFYCMYPSNHEGAQNYYKFIQEMVAKNTGKRNPNTEENFLFISKYRDIIREGTHALYDVDDCLIDALLGVE